MVSDDEIHLACAVLARRLDAYLASKEAGTVAVGDIAAIGKDLATLPGAYTAIKKAQAEGKYDANMIASVLLLYSYVAVDNLIRFPLEIAAFEAYKANPDNRWQEKPVTIHDLLAAFKRADDNDRISRMSAIHDEIMQLGATAQNPGEIYKAMNEFANTEPGLKGTIKMYIRQIKAIRRQEQPNAAAMERLADMKKDPPSAKDLGSPGHAPPPPRYVSRRQQS